jgi:hypothetical protein
MEHIYDQPCKRCKGVPGLVCKVCDGLGMTASFAAVKATLGSDPFAQASAQGMSFRPGQAMPKADRSVVRSSWPFGSEPKAVKAKPSSWPF